MYVEGSTALLECPRHLFPSCIAEQCYDKIPGNYLDTVTYVDHITRQTFEYANQIPFENSPQHVIALDPDTDQYSVLTPQLFKKILFNTLNLLKSKPLLTLTPLLSKMHVYVPRKNSNMFGIVFSSLNILILPYNSLVKLLAMNSRVNKLLNFFQRFHINLVHSASMIKC